MRKLMRLGVVTGVMTLGITLVASAAFAASATKPTAILGSGSDTTYPMMVQLDQLYNDSPGCETVAVAPQVQPLDFSCLPDLPNTITAENYAHDQVTEAYPLGSSNGINQLCLGKAAGAAPISFARSSRVPGGSDCTGLNFVGYARGGLAWECWPTPTDGTSPGCTGVTNLTQPQLNKIFVTCAYTNWNQVGGNNVPIDVYQAQPGSGTLSTWQGFVGGTVAGAYACIPPAFQLQPNGVGSHIAEEHDNTLIDVTNPAGGFADQGNAIYYIEFGRWTNAYSPTGTNPDGSVLGQVNGVTPSISSIQDLSYPFGRYLFNVYCVAKVCGGSKKAKAPVVNYVGPQGWICKSENKHKTGGVADVNPLTGNLFRGPPSGGQPTGDIPNAIRKAGFVPLITQSGGNYCFTLAT